MEYVLMHKNIKTAKVSIKGGEMSVLQVLNTEHLPLYCIQDITKIKRWWNKRAIPRTRQGGARALDALNESSYNALMIKNRALSLTDCYWIKGISEDVKWEDVSFFSNEFTDVFGELTFGYRRAIGDDEIQYGFTATQTKGDLQKKWKITSNGNRVLIKGNTSPSCRQSLNEVMASNIHAKQGLRKGIDFVEYGITEIKNRTGKYEIGCYCENYCSESVEFIPVDEILGMYGFNAHGKNGFYTYNELVNVLVKLYSIDTNYIHTFLSYQLMTDFLMSNEDRHANNFGILRNPDTLEFLGFAPIFDTGNSMVFEDIRRIRRVNPLKIATNSFEKREVDGLRLVREKEIVNLSLLPNEKEFKRLYSKDKASDNKTTDILFKLYSDKIALLDEFQHGKEIWKRYR